MGFNDIHLNQWRAYERVRASGLYNMLDPRARLAASLSVEEYAFVLRNHEALRVAVLKDDKQ